MSITGYSLLNITFSNFSEYKLTVIPRIFIPSLLPPLQPVELGLRPPHIVNPVLLQVEEVPLHPTDCCSTPTRVEQI